MFQIFYLIFSAQHCAVYCAGWLMITGPEETTTLDSAVLCSTALTSLSTGGHTNMVRFKCILLLNFANYKFISYSFWSMMVHSCDLVRLRKLLYCSECTPEQGWNKENNVGRAIQKYFVEAVSHQWIYSVPDSLWVPLNWDPQRQTFWKWNAYSGLGSPHQWRGLEPVRTSMDHPCMDTWMEEDTIIWNWIRKSGFPCMLSSDAVITWLC